MVSRYYLGWPFCLHRGNSASKNLQQETQRPKCCLYKTPYITAPVRETGDVIARTPLYAQLPSDAPTRTRINFWFMNNTFLKRPILLKEWLLRTFSTRKPHAKAVPLKDYFTQQKQYHKRTTLLTLPWKTQERDAEWSAPTIMRHIHGASVLLGTTITQRYDAPRDWLCNACHMAGVCWWSGCKGFRSEEGLHYCLEQSARKLSLGKQQSTLFTSLEILSGFLTQAVLRSLAGLMSREKVSAWGFCEQEKVWFAFSQWTFAPETFCKRQKGERNLVVSLLPGSHKRLTSRNPRVLCQKYGGACTT